MCTAMFCVDVLCEIVQWCDRKQLMTLRLASRNCELVARRYLFENFCMYGCCALLLASKYPNQLRIVSLGECVRCGKELGLLRGVRKVDLSNTNVTDAMLEYFESVSAINLSNCHYFTDSGLGHLRNADTVLMHECPQITNDGLRHLGAAKEIAINGCPKVTGNGLLSLSSVKELTIDESMERSAEVEHFLRNVHVTIIYGSPRRPFFSHGF